MAKYQEYSVRTISYSNSSEYEAALNTLGDQGWMMCASEKIGTYQEGDKTITTKEVVLMKETNGPHNAK